MDIKVLGGQIIYPNLNTGIEENEYAIAKSHMWLYMLNENRRPTRWFKATKNGTKVNFEMIRSQVDYDNGIDELQFFINNVNEKFGLKFDLILENSEASSCLAENCKNTILVAKGLCMKHYKRNRRTGTINDDFINKGKKCKIDECNKDAETKGYCPTHYYRMKKYNNPHKGKVNKKNVNITCLITTCKNLSLTTHLCSKHYTNYQYYKRSLTYTNVEDYVKFRNEAKN